MKILGLAAACSIGLTLAMRLRSISLQRGELNFGPPT